MTHEWESEPNRELWTDETTGYPCLIRRGPGGALCGYVAVPESHPFFGKSYTYVNGWDDDDLRATRSYYGSHGQGKIDVHGGVTYAGECDGDPVEGICHVSDGEDEVWWFGFDCAHCMDCVPRIPRSRLLPYRNWAYVRSEVESMAKQLHVLAAGVA